MMALLDKTMEDTNRTIKESFDVIYEQLEIIWRRCELDQYTKADLKAEIKELLERMI